MDNLYHSKPLCPSKSCYYALVGRTDTTFLPLHRTYLSPLYSARQNHTRYACLRDPQRLHILIRIASIRLGEVLSRVRNYHLCSVLSLRQAREIQTHLHHFRSPVQRGPARSLRGTRPQTPSYRRRFSHRFRVRPSIKYRVTSREIASLTSTFWHPQGYS